MSLTAALWTLLLCFVWGVTAGAVAVCVWLVWRLWDRHDADRP